MSPSWENRLEATCEARMDVAGENGFTASWGLPLPENVTWHRISLVAPILEDWGIVTDVLALVAVQNPDELAYTYRFISRRGFILGREIGCYLPGLIMFITLWVELGLLGWWWHAYAMDADDIYLHSGILSRKPRTARLPHIQPVDVVCPLFRCVFGLGQLIIGVVGGWDLWVVVGFFTTRELQTLHDRILDLIAGQIDLPDPATEGGAVGVSTEGPDTGRTDDAASAVRPEGFAPEGAIGSQAVPEHRAVPIRAPHFQGYPLCSVDGATLLGSPLRSSSVYVLGLTVIGILSAGTLIILDFMAGGEAPTVISSHITVAIGTATIAQSQLNSVWNFQAATAPNGIHMRYGLTSDTSRTLPLRRAHSVGIAQPILQRGKDWWKVDVTATGREDRPQDGQNWQFGNLLLPVGSRDIVLHALWLAVPDLGVSDPDRLFVQALIDCDDDGVDDPQAPTGSAERGFVCISHRGRSFYPLT